MLSCLKSVTHSRSNRSLLRSELWQRWLGHDTGTDSGYQGHRAQLSTVGTGMGIRTPPVDLLRQTHRSHWVASCDLGTDDSLPLAAGCLGTAGAAFLPQGGPRLPGRWRKTLLRLLLRRIAPRVLRAGSGITSVAWRPVPDKCADHWLHAAHLDIKPGMGRAGLARRDWPSPLSHYSKGWAKMA